jgi:hypothetical protein
LAKEKSDAPTNPVVAFHKRSTWAEREWGAPYAFVEYYNSEDQMSAHFPRTLTAGDLTVQLELNITQGPEVLTVHPPPGWTVVGDATISVADGDRGYVELIRGGQGM